MVATAKDYVPKYQSLPHNVYMQVLYLIRDYDRMKAEYNAVVDESPVPPDGAGGKSGPSDPTGNKAVKLESLGRKISAVETGLNAIPEEYRKAIYNNIVYRIPYDTRYTSYYTYRYHRSRAMRVVARKLGMI